MRIRRLATRGSAFPPVNFVACAAASASVGIVPLNIVYFGIG